VKLFGHNFNRSNKEISNQVYKLTDAEDALLKALGLDTSTISTDKIGEITFYVCLKFLAESIGKLPILQYTKSKKKGKEPYFDDHMDRLLNIEPNPYMTASSFWQAIENNRNYYGNAYYYIERRLGDVDSLWIVPSGEMQIYLDDEGIFKKKNALYYVWTDKRTSKKYYFNQGEIAHLKSSTTFDGIVGMAVKDVLRLNIEIGQYSQAYLQKLYAGNMYGGKIILQHTAAMDKPAKEVLIKEVESYANEIGTGKFLPLPMGVSATQMEMKLSDAEFTELNKLNALQIASAFGIKPNILNNYDKSSYANSETQQLDFYINTLSPTVKQYKEENTRKLVYGHYLEHDVKALFKLDPVKQMTVLQKGINNFMMTPNECREELGLPYIDNNWADKLIGNGNYKTIEQIINESEEGGKSE